MPKYPNFPSFSYVPRPYESRHTGTIGDLMYQRSHRLREQGDQTARLYLAGGQMIQNAVGGYVQDRERRREQERQAQIDARQAEADNLRLEAGRMELDDAKRKRKGEQLTRDLSAFALRQSDDGFVDWDLDLIAKEFTAAGMSDQLPEVVGRLQSQSEQVRKLRLANDEFIGNQFGAALQSGAQPESIEALLEFHAANGTLPEKQAQHYRRQLKTGKAAEVAKELAMRSPSMAETLNKTTNVARGGAVVREATGEVLYENPNAPQPSTPNPNEEALALRAAQGDPEARKALEILKAQRPAPASGGGGGPRPLTQNAEAQMIGRLANQWTTVNKPVTELDRQLAIMDAGVEAEKRGDVAQANEVVLQTFLKVIDPNSVVREGEFWRLQQGQSLINRAKAAYQRIKDGGWVTGDELKKYAQLAHEIRDSLVKSQEPTRRRLSATADRYNIPHELIFATDAPSGAPGGGPAPGDMVPMIAPDGGALMVPAADVEQLEKLGAKRAGGG